MATRARATFPLLFLLGTSLLFAAAVSASHDDEDDRRGGHSLQQCVQRCRQERPRYSHARCVQECRDDQQQHGRHEQEEEQGRGRGWHGEGEREEEHGRGRGRHGEGEREEEHGRGRGRHGEGEREEERGRHGEGEREEERGRGRGRHGEGEREEEEGRGRGRRGEGERDEEQGDSRRPYVFGPRSFRRIIQSDHGFVRALRPFDQVSRLLRGIRDYRVAIMEVNPRAFVVPGFTDADGVGYVAQGEGVLTVIENGEKRSYTVKEGDVIVAPAGSIMHLANTDGRRKLVIAKILHTISVPGKFQAILSVKPLLASLSKRVLRAAFKTSDERLERLFNQRQGQEKTRSVSIVRASEEQLRELRRQASEGGQGHRWPLPPFRGDSATPSTFWSSAQRSPTAMAASTRPTPAASTLSPTRTSASPWQTSRRCVTNLQRLIGSMTAPYLNTQSFKLAVVLEGEGEVQIVCPHLGRESESEREHEHGKGRRREEEEDQRRRGSESESEEEEEQQRYETVRARVSRGSAFVVPPGHPVVEISSSQGSSNLQVVCFEINAERNERVWLAGRNNVIGKLGSPAQELTFGRPARDVQEVFRAQDQDEGFVAGPEQQSREQEHRRRGDRGRGDEAVETFLRMATGAI
ncbi:hypothetical protein ZWY2020_054072 [Hordeum vulgare]|nr:hypothetical protein ZWY2020_054072 [Hordeum vulgare]